MSSILIQTVYDIHQAHTTVVPIVAQAGTALFPLIVLAITSMFGLLLRPRELLRMVRGKPWIVFVLVAIISCGWLAVEWVFLRSSPTLTERRSGESQVSSSVSRTDWAAVAMRIIAQESASTAGSTTLKIPAAIFPVATLPVGSLSLDSLPLDSIATKFNPTPTGPLIFRGNPSRSGYLGGALPTRLTPTWSFYAQDERNAMALSSPAVRNGMIYGTSCYLSRPSSFGTIFCLDATSGALQWLIDAQDAAGTAPFKGFFSSPAISADGRFLIVGQGLHLDFDSDLVCVDTANGGVHWIASTSLHIESSPAIEGDMVVVGVGAVEQGNDHRPQGALDGPGNPGFVLGMRISDGVELFRAPVIDPEGSPVLIDGICYIGSGVNGNAVVALRTGTDAVLQAANQSREVWRTATPFPATGAVSVVGDLVIVGIGKGDFVSAAAEPEGRVVALDRTTGAVRWQTSVPDAVLGPIGIHGDLAVVPVRNGEVIAMSIKDKGRISWRSAVHGTAPVLAGPVVTETLVYAVSNDGYLAIFDARDGKMLERSYINAQGRPGEMGLSTSAPVVSDGRLYVGSETGGLRCFTGSAP